MNLSEQNYLTTPEPTRTLKPSEAMRIGALEIPETTMSHHGCALGTAYKFVTGKSLVHAAGVNSKFRNIGAFNKYVVATAELFNAPMHLVCEAERMHLFGGECSTTGTRERGE